MQGFPFLGIRELWIEAIWDLAGFEMFRGWDSGLGFWSLGFRV